MVETLIPINVETKKELREQCRKLGMTYDAVIKKFLRLYQEDLK